MKLQQTIFQKIEFGSEPSDCYYCLIDSGVSPNGLSIEKMRLTDPRNIDLQFRQAGCLMMFTGEEIEELIRRGEVDSDKIHQSLFKLAIKEGVIKND